MKEKKLSEKQKKFCEFYVASSNATESAIKAGYSESYAQKRIYEMLENVGIKSYIEELNQEIRNERIADITEIQEFLTSILRGKTKEEVIVSEMLGDGRSVSKIILKQVAVKERLRAGELLGKSKMMFSDKLQVESVIPVLISGEDELEE